MHYITGLLFVAACVCSAIALPPCTCTRNYKPVCGSDGNTYNNECLLNCERHTKKRDLSVAKEGPCGAAPINDCICTYEFRPVCGSDGTTYPNSCTLRCARSDVPSLELRHEGRCKREAIQVARLDPCICTREMKPVCGSDGATYNNQCLLNCASQANPNLRVQHTGPCDDRVKIVDQPQNDSTPSCACTRNLDPVCGSDGVTYNNICIMQCRGGSKVTVARHGPCES